MTTDPLPTKVSAVRYVGNVAPGGRKGKWSPGLPWRRSDVRVVLGDPLIVFTTAVLKQRPVRMTLISPWLSFDASSDLGLLIAHARRCDTRVTLVTRPPLLDGAVAAVEAVCALPQSRVILCESLHAKTYVSECGDGSGLAFVGSANLTEGAQRLFESGLLVRSYRGRGVILRDLGETTVKAIAALKDSNGHAGCSTTSKRRRVKQ